MQRTSSPLTRNNLLKVLSKKDYVDLGGVIIEFNKEHMLSNVYLSIYDEGAFHTIDIRQF